MRLGATLFLALGRLTYVELLLGLDLEVPAQLRRPGQGVEEPTHRRSWNFLPGFVFNLLAWLDDGDD